MSSCEVSAFLAISLSALDDIVPPNPFPPRAFRLMVLEDLFLMLRRLTTERPTYFLVEALSYKILSYSVLSSNHDLGGICVKWC